MKADYTTKIHSSLGESFHTIYKSNQGHNYLFRCKDAPEHTQKLKIGVGGYCIDGVHIVDLLSACIDRLSSPKSHKILSEAIAQLYQVQDLLTTCEGEAALKAEEKQSVESLKDCVFRLYKELGIESER
ncbi:hypothetical protein [Piscirickettsia litoralis]|uniref:Uncharacterized protein n=1 Tax=Piscirickettsia litoralis TaxID=1891921 RepID=A0ABX3A1G1_9GAMM|nr:hypothetical protein [Piscirickettsia litoralis]ODN41240.1 hypothetical protein BGC07_17655 [Piscirickettsia litoralis]